MSNLIDTWPPSTCNFSSAETAWQLWMITWLLVPTHSLTHPVYFLGYPQEKCYEPRDLRAKSTPTGERWPGHGDHFLVRDRIGHSDAVRSEHPCEGCSSSPSPRPTRSTRYLGSAFVCVLVCCSPFVVVVPCTLSWLFLMSPVVVVPGVPCLWLYLTYPVVVVPDVPCVWSYLVYSVCGCTWCTLLVVVPGVSCRGLFFMYPVRGRTWCTLSCYCLFSSSWLLSLSVVAPYSDCTSWTFFIFPVFQLVLSLIPHPGLYSSIQVLPFVTDLAENNEYVFSFVTAYIPVILLLVLINTLYFILKVLWFWGGVYFILPCRCHLSQSFFISRFAFLL